MTTLITRLFDSASSAYEARTRLMDEGFPARLVSVVSGEDASKEALSDAGLDDKTAKAYASGASKGNAVLMVKADYRPLGARRIARQVLSEVDTIDVADATEETTVESAPLEGNLSVLTDHPRFFTMVIDDEDFEPQPVSRRIGLPLLSSRKPQGKTLIDGTITGRFLPIPLLKTDREADSAMSGTHYMSKKFLNTPLVQDNKRRKSVIPGTWRLFTDVFNWPTIIRR